MPARLKALQNSLIIEEPAKQKYKEVLKADLMSSNESIRQDFLMMSGSNRDERGPPAKKVDQDFVFTSRGTRINKTRA